MIHINNFDYHRSIFADIYTAVNSKNMIKSILHYKDEVYLKSNEHKIS